MQGLQCSGYHVRRKPERSLVRNRAENVGYYTFIINLVSQMLSICDCLERTQVFMWSTKSLTNIPIIQILNDLQGLLKQFPQCSGYHVRLTRERSLVRDRAETSRICLFHNHGTRLANVVHFKLSKKNASIYVGNQLLTNLLK